MKRVRNDIFKEILSSVREGNFIDLRFGEIRVGTFNIYVALGFHYYAIRNYKPSKDNEGWFGPIQRVLFHRAYVKALEDRVLSDFRERMFN